MGQWGAQGGMGRWVPLEVAFWWDLCSNPIGMVFLLATPSLSFPIRGMVPSP